jgi:hypothetical protein
MIIYEIINRITEINLLTELKEILIYVISLIHYFISFEKANG